MDQEAKNVHTGLQVDVAKLTVKVENVLVRLEEVLNTLKDFATQKDIESLSKRIDVIEGSRGKYGHAAVMALIGAAIGGGISIIIQNIT